MVGVERAFKWLAGGALATLLLGAHCKKKDGPAPIGCPTGATIQAKIAELKAKPKSNPAYEVWQYRYQGHRVYRVTAPCCDQFETLYDECLNVLCAPSGGLTGRGDGRCPQFYKQADSARLLWRDPR